MNRCKHGLNPDWCADCRARNRSAGPVRLDPWGHRIGGACRPSNSAPATRRAKPKQPRRQAAVRDVWASRTPEQRAAIGQKISAARKGWKPSIAAVAKRATRSRQTWIARGAEARRAQTAAAVAAASAKLKGTDRRREINRAASEAARQRPLEERQASARRGLATRRREGTQQATVAAMHRAARSWWAALSAEERSAICRERALKRWRRARGEES